MLIQTVPVEGDAPFAALRDRLNVLLAKRGHRMVEETGSASWLYGAAYAKPLRRRTAFKLLASDAEAILFGVRDEFLAEVPQLAAIRWPRQFAVKPHAAVTFRGFDVRRDDPDAGVARVELILGALPKVDPAFELRIDRIDPAVEAEFDRQLSALKGPGDARAK